jgi:hypothetical protein
MQKTAVQSYYEQNSFVAVHLLHQLQIKNPQAYLESELPGGVYLDNFYIKRSILDELEI